MAAKEEIKVKEQQKTEKGKDEKDNGVINAVYKVNLHCHQCAREIKKPLLRTQGVQNVEADLEKGEIKAKGIFDPKKIQEKIEKLTKKKIELISPKVQIKEIATTEKKVQITKQKQAPKEQDFNSLYEDSSLNKILAISRTIPVKVHLHCEKCEKDLERKLLRHKGIHGVKTDMKSQTLNVDGTIEPEKLISFIRRKVHKNAELITPKLDKKEEKKEKGDTSKPSDNKEKETSIEKTEKMVEIREEVKIVEGNAPYFIHYVYAPQLFSDENPNACSIM